MDLLQIRKRQQETWATGDFAKIGAEQTIVGELLCEAVPVHAGDRVLDIATGAGNTALAAARRRCTVTGVDFVPALLERGRQRAVAEGLEIDFREGDAMELPFPDRSFDVILSTFGVMFAPDPRVAVAEMVRVCRPGGRIAMANWTPQGLIGKLFLLTARFAPPPPGVAAPVLWGDEAAVRERLEPHSEEIRVQRQMARFRALSPGQWVTHMRTHFGPAIRAFASLPESGQQSLAAEMEDLVRENNHARNQTVLAEGEYLEIVATLS
ncbi:MAG: class I SAM-dependent methyltransferase [Bryobacteraceae bacterium]